jgi:rod shape-determining protein MreB
VIFYEPAALSFDAETNKVTGIGNETKHDTLNVVKRPVDGVIADFHAFGHLLRGAIKQAMNEKTWFPSRYKMYFSIPIGTTEVEKRAYRDSAELARAKEAWLVSQPYCSAISMGILFEKKHFILVDIDAGKIEMSAFSDSRIIASESIRFGTLKLKKILRNCLFRLYDVEPSDEDLEYVFENLSDFSETCRVGDKTIKSEDLQKAIDPCFMIIEDQLLELLEKASRDPNADKIMANGYIFTGGGSNIPWVVKRMTLNSQMKVALSSNTFLENIYGLTDIINEPKRYKSIMW